MQESYKLLKCIKSNQPHEIRNLHINVDNNFELEKKLTLKTTKWVMLSMIKSLGNLPKNKKKMLKFVKTIITTKANSKNLSSEDCQILSNSDQLKLWVLRLLEEKNIIQYDNSLNSKLTINKDKMNEYLGNFDENNCEDDVSKILFPD